MELDKLPPRIEELETARDELVQAMSEPGFFDRPADQVGADNERLTSLQAELDEVYARWEALETIAEGGA